MKLNITCTAENNEDLEFFKDLMDLASEATKDDYEGSLDFSSVLLVSDPEEKFRPMNCVAMLLESLLSRDENNIVNALILTEPNSVWENKFDNYKDKITICYTWQEFVLKSHLGRHFNFIVIDSDMGNLLLDDAEQCIQTVKFYRYYTQSFGCFIYTEPDYFDVCMDLMGDMFTFIQTYHVSNPTHKLETLFKDVRNLKDQEFLLAIPKDESLISVKDVTDQVLVESLKDPRQ